MPWSGRCAGGTSLRQRVDRFITQSSYVAARIRRVYGRETCVVPPPVEVERFAKVRPRDEGYFLIVARFEAYKRIDLAIQACAGLGVPLRIVGAGVDEGRLRRSAAGAPNVRFLGPLPDEAVVEQIAGCRALLFPGEEDFGLTALEAQAAGKGVIAYAEGGALDTVLPGLRGSFSISRRRTPWPGLSTPFARSGTIPRLPAPTPRATPRLCSGNGCARGGAGSHGSHEMRRG